MELTKQVCSLELAKRLKELGVKQESQHYWWKLKQHSGTGMPSEHYVMLSPEIDNRKISDYTDRYPDAEIYAAFTVAELGEMIGYGGAYPLPTYDSFHKTWYTMKDDGYGDDENVWLEADTEADARAKMLIYLLENKLITL